LIQKEKNIFLSFLILLLIAKQTALKFVYLPG